jgi:hypothetical protein
LYSPKDYKRILLEGGSKGKWDLKKKELKEL